MNTAASSTSPQPPLDQPLPADLIAGVTWGPFHYRRYPVFSWPWFLRRLLAVTAALALYGGLVALGYLAKGTTATDTAAITGYFFVGMLLMFTPGPAFATWVRHRRFSESRERWLVIASVCVGVVVGFAADSWVSHRMKPVMHMKDVPRAERKLGDSERATLALAGIGFGFLYIVGGGGLAAAAYFSESRRLRARSAHLARLDADMRLSILQAQVEPHFLFNTLASIRPLVRQDAGRAEAAIDAFARHLRDTLPQIRAQSGTVNSTLGQQVDICASYLDVMQVRMDDRLQSTIAVESEMRGLEFPPLMLLSLVENAIKHGLEPKPGRGRVWIEAQTSGKSLLVNVVDDGVGLKQGLSSGLGLSNIREQLAMRFAGQATLSVTARPDGGTVAGITIPLRVAQS